MIDNDNLTTNRNFGRIGNFNPAFDFGEFQQFLPNQDNILDAEFLDDGPVVIQTQNNPPNNGNLDETYAGSTETKFSWNVKNIGLYGIAGICFTIGLIWFVTASKTGKRVINVAVSAASKGQANNVMDTSESKNDSSEETSSEKTSSETDE